MGEGDLAKDLDYIYTLNATKKKGNEFSVARL